LTNENAGKQYLTTRKIMGLRYKEMEKEVKMRRRDV